MVEVTNQLAPLIKELGRVSTNQERLYNSNGGPPGFLQTARSEDKGTFKMIFETLEEHKEDIQPIKDFIRDHKAQEETRALDQDSLSKRLNVRLVILGIVIAALQLFAPSMQGCRKAASTLINPAAQSQLQPQVSTIPELR